jgi:transposase-like protein
MAAEFKGRWFAKEIILQNLRWYLTYTLSYLDLKEMMGKRSTSGLVSSERGGVAKA